MRLLELLGQRWMLRILWEMRDDAYTFRALQTRCERVSPTILNNRLKELKDLDLVLLTDNGYELTKKGQELILLLIPLNQFSKRLFEKG